MGVVLDTDLSKRSSLFMRLGELTRIRNGERTGDDVVDGGDTFRPSSGCRVVVELGGKCSGGPPISPG